MGNMLRIDSDPWELLHPMERPVFDPHQEELDRVLDEWGILLHLAPEAMIYPAIRSVLAFGIRSFDLER